MIPTSIVVIDTGTRTPHRVPPSLTVIHMPVLQRLAIDLDRDALDQALSLKRHILFYSEFAAQTILDAEAITAPVDHRIWAVGAQTARLLSEGFGVSVDTPRDESFEGLLQTLQDDDEPLPLLSLSLRGVLRDLGPLARRWNVDFTDIPVYESAPADPGPLREAFDAHKVLWMTLTSSRGVEAVVDALDAERLRERQKSSTLYLAAIGPSTKDTLQHFGLRADVIPTNPRREDLLQAIADYANTHLRTPRS